MTLAEISNLRIINQRIAKSEFKTPKEIVSWMGAMQAQDYSMAKWAIGVRILNPTIKVIETEIDKGEVLRTHLMRPTWHFVSADDIYWMLELTAPRIMSSLKFRQRYLELSDVIMAKSNDTIEKALSGNLNLTREELTVELHKVNIKTNENRLSHLLVSAELNGIICSGKAKGNKVTYSLLNERVNKKIVLTREESLAELGKRYIRSHGPATLNDFIWWSGLSPTEAKHAFELVKSEFITETIGTEKYWFTNSISNFKAETDYVYLLPAYDEFLISYKDRSVSLALSENKKAISNNGIFHPVIVVNGQVVGIWKKIIKKDIVSIRTEFFEKPNTNILNMVEEFGSRYGDFINRKVIFD